MRVRALIFSKAQYREFKRLPTEDRITVSHLPYLELDIADLFNNLPDEIKKWIIKKEELESILFDFGRLLLVALEIDLALCKKDYPPAGIETLKEGLKRIQTRLLEQGERIKLIYETI